MASHRCWIRSGNVSVTHLFTSVASCWYNVLRGLSVLFRKIFAQHGGRVGHGRLSGDE